MDIAVAEKRAFALVREALIMRLLCFVELGERGKEFSAKDLVSSVFSAANRKMKKREKSSKSVSSVDTGSVDSGDVPGIDQPPCEYNERNIDREIELRSITEDSLNSSGMSSFMSRGSEFTGHGMATSSSTLTSTLSQERLLQQMVNSTHQRSARSASSAGIQQHRARSHERLLSQQMQVHSHSAGNLPSMAAAGSGVTSPEPLGGSTRDGIYNAKLVYITGTESQPNMTSTPQQPPEPGQTNRRSVHYEVTKYPAYQLEQYQLFQTENAKPQLSLRRGSADSVLSERRGDDEVGHHPSSVTKSRAYQAQQHLKRLQLDAAALRQKDEARRIESEKRAIAKQRIELELEKTRAELERDDSLEELLAKPTQIAAQIADFHSRQQQQGSATKADTTSLTSTSDYSTMSSTATTAGQHQLTTVPERAHSQPPQSSIPYESRATGKHVSPSEGGKYFMDTSPAPQVHETRNIKQKGSMFDTSKVAGKGTLSRKKGGAQSSPIATRRQPRDSSPSSAERRSRPRHRYSSDASQRRGSLDSNRDLYERPYSALGSDSEISEDFVDSMTSAFDEKLKLLSDGAEHVGDARKPDTYTVQYCESSSGPPLQLSLPHSLDYYEMHRNNSESMLFDKYFNNDLRLKTFRTGDPKIGIASRFERHDPDGKPSSQKMVVDNRNSITKSEKTDMNLLMKEKDARALEYAQELRRSSEKLYSSKERLVDIGLTDDNIMEPELHRMPSPVVVRRRIPAERKKLRRRHTVGGTQDLDHFKALMTATGSQDQRSPTGGTQSAWERLQPGITIDSHSSEGSTEAPSIMSWLQQQRLRHVGSSPAVFQGDQYALHDHDYFSNDQSQHSRLQPVSAHYGTPRNPLHYQHQRHSQPPLSGYGASERLELFPGDSRSHPLPDSPVSSNSSSPQSKSSTSRSSKATSFTFESSI